MFYKVLRVLGMHLPRLESRAETGNAGIWAALGSGVLWGALPLYWNLLKDIHPFIIVCQRIVWSFVFLLPLVMLAGRMSEVAGALRNAKVARIFFCSSLVVACNWGLYIWAVNVGRVVETSLGYYISPLITICMGVVVFHDRPSRVRWIAIGIAAVGIAAEIIIDGSAPWLGLAIGGSFSIYALLRKLVPVESLPGLMTEMIILLPFAVGCLVWKAGQPGPGVWGQALPDAMLLSGTGIVTSVPLLLYAYGARHLPFTTLGILQYLSPTMTALLGFFVFMESVSTGRVVSLTTTIFALIIYTADSFRYSAKHSAGTSSGKSG